MGLGRRSETLNLFYLAENMLGTQDDQVNERES